MNSVLGFPCDLLHGYFPHGHVVSPGVANAAWPAHCSPAVAPIPVSMSFPTFSTSTTATASSTNPHCPPMAAMATTVEQKLARDIFEGYNPVYPSHRHHSQPQQSHYRGFSIHNESSRPMSQCNRPAFTGVTKGGNGRPPAISRDRTESRIRGLGERKFDGFFQSLNVEPEELSKRGYVGQQRVKVSENRVESNSQVGANSNISITNRNLNLGRTDAMHSNLISNTNSDPTRHYENPSRQPQETFSPSERNISSLQNPSTQLPEELTDRNSDFRADDLGIWMEMDMEMDMFDKTGLPFPPPLDHWINYEMDREEKGDSHSCDNRTDEEYEDDDEGGLAVSEYGDDDGDNFENRFEASDVYTKWFKDIYHPHHLGRSSTSGQKRRDCDGVGELGGEADMSPLEVVIGHRRILEPSATRKRRAARASQGTRSIVTEASDHPPPSPRGNLDTSEIRRVERKRVCVKPVRDAKGPEGDAGQLYSFSEDSDMQDADTVSSDYMDSDSQIPSHHQTSVDLFMPFLPSVAATPWGLNTRGDFSAAGYGVLDMADAFTDPSVAFRKNNIDRLMANINELGV